MLNCASTYKSKAFSAKLDWIYGEKVRQYIPAENLDDQTTKHAWWALQRK